MNGAQATSLHELASRANAAGSVAYLLSVLLLLFAGVLVVPLVVAAVYHEGPVVEAFAYTILASLLAGLCGVFLLRGVYSGLGRREGFAVVGMGWILISLVGTLPFYLSGTLGFVDSFFECASSFSGAGASVISNVEATARGILFWRAFLNWVGGMGFVVLYLAVFPLLGVGAMRLYQAEPGPEKDKITPRIRNTAKVMWLIYVSLSAGCLLLLMAAGMGFFDAVCHAFSTVATGGLSTRNASVGAYGSAAIEWIVLVFMFLSATNFALYYFALRGKVTRLFKDPEWRFFLLVLVVVSLVCSLLVMTQEGASWAALRHGAFTTVAIASTTAFVTADYGQWPALAQFLLLLCMFVGGCAGSTSGGMKMVRVLITLKHARRQIGLVIHPRMVSPLRLGGRTLTVEAIRGVLAFLGLYLAIAIAATAAVSLAGLDFTSAVSGVAASLSGTGSALGELGPSGSWGAIHSSAKVVLASCMLVGRLELYTILVLLTPAFWRRA